MVLVRAAMLRNTSAVIVLGLCFAQLVACSGSTEGSVEGDGDDHAAHGEVGGDDPDDGLGELLDDTGTAPDTATPDGSGDARVAEAAVDAASDARDGGTSATPTCDADAKVGDYCGGDKVSNADAKTLYHCTGAGAKATVVRVCSAGCVVAAAGSDDYCKSTSTTPTTPAVEACPHVAAILKYGLHPIASDRLRCAGITAARITQTIGSAAASAGTHAQDGTIDGKPYCAATDLSVSGLTDTQVKTLIAKLDTLGFAAFYRKPGYDGWPASEARHIHAVFAGAKMKSSLQTQIYDFLAGKNGLASHTAYTFYQAPADIKAFIKAIFLAAN